MTSILQVMESHTTDHATTDKNKAGSSIYTGIISRLKSLKAKYKKKCYLNKNENILICLYLKYLHKNIQETVDNIMSREVNENVGISFGVC